MKAVCMGDIGVDDYSGKLYPGGCALNVAYNAKKSGFNIDLVSCVGSDKASQIPLNVVKRLKLNETYIHQLSGETPKQKILALPGGEKKFIGYFPGVLSDFKLDQKDIDFINQHEVLITLFYSQIKHLFEQVTKIKFSGLKVVDFMDSNDFNKDINFVKKYANWWDISFFGLSGKDSQFIQQLMQLAKNLTKIVVITLGSGGSLAVYQSKIYKQRLKPIRAVDTTGCGDAYIAGFLTNWLQHKNIQPAMEAGSTLAASVAKHPGAINPKIR